MSLRQIWRPILALVLASALLFGLSAALRGVEASNAQKERDFVLSWLLTDSESFEQISYTGEEPAITAVYQGETGCVVEVTTDGYADAIVLWVGVKNDGTVTGLTVRDMAETHTLGREALFNAGYLLQYLRTDGNAAVGQNIDTLTGATVTAKAITWGVNAAVAYVTGEDITSGATTWGG